MLRHIIAECDSSLGGIVGRSSMISISEAKESCVCVLSRTMDLENVIKTNCSWKTRRDEISVESESKERRGEEGDTRTVANEVCLSVLLTGRGVGEGWGREGMDRRMEGSSDEKVKEKKGIEYIRD